MKRKRRCITATDSEWASISALAYAAEMDISSYIRSAILEHRPAVPAAPAAVDNAAPAIPSELQWQTSHAVLLIKKLIEGQYEAAGKRQIFDDVSRNIDTRLTLTGKIG